MNARTAVIPVQAWSVGKTRLHDDADVRSTFARAFTLDLLDVVRGCPAIGTVVVVTTEPSLLVRSGPRGVVVLRDPVAHIGPPLDAAVEAGRSWAATHRPRSPIVVVPTDLPAMSAADLSLALDALADRAAFVPDADGRGTTLLAAAHPRGLVHAYGVGSAERHRRLGAASVTAVPASVRHDVDTMTSLQDAENMGLAGGHTRRALAQLSGLPG